MRPTLLALCLLLISGLAIAQDGLQRASRRTQTAGNLADSPVTQQEVNITLARVEKAISRLGGMQSFKVTQRPSKAGPASRQYIILELNKIFERVKPKFKFTPRKVIYDAKQLVVNSSVKAPLQKLISWGFVAKVGPLATGPKDTLGLKHFGDAVGLFVLRVSDLTHNPDPKFSPGMMERIGG